jgi:uncharacterized protein YdaU (DUF1376 family)
MAGYQPHVSADRGTVKLKPMVTKGWSQDNDEYLLATIAGRNPTGLQEISHRISNEIQAVAKAAANKRITEDDQNAKRKRGRAKKAEENARKKAATAQRRLISESIETDMNIRITPGNAGVSVPSGVVNQSTASRAVQHLSGQPICTQSNTGMSILYCIDLYCTSQYTLMFAHYVS